MESIKKTIKKKKGKLGGKRKGAGRPKGKLSIEATEEIATAKEYRAKIRTIANKLFKAQCSVALGNQMLFKIETKKYKEGKVWKERRTKPILVTDRNEIEEYLMARDDIDLKDPNKYFFVTTERPDNKAIDSMLDRSFGKAQENLDLTTKGEKIYDDDQSKRIAERVLARRGKRDAGASS